MNTTGEITKERKFRNNQNGFSNFLNDAKVAAINQSELNLISEAGSPPSPQ